MSRNGTALDRAIRTSWRNYAIAVLLIIAIGLIVITYFKSSADNTQANDRITHTQQHDSAVLACITRWANATAARSGYLQRYAKPRNDAQSDFEVAIANGADRATVNRLRVAFIHASDAYNLAQAKAPLPPPPLLDCKHVSATSASPPGPPSSASRSITGTPRAAPSSASSATRTPAAGATSPAARAGSTAAAARAATTARSVPSPTPGPARTPPASSSPTSRPAPLLPLPDCTVSLLTINLC